MEGAMSGALRIWVQWARKSTQCAFCKEEIKIGQSMVRGRGMTADNRYLSFSWHFENGPMSSGNCWMEQGKEYLSSNPFTPMPGGKGRKPLNLDTPTQRKRDALLARLRRYQAKKENAIKQGWLWAIPGLEEKVTEILKEMESFGGLPLGYKEG